MNETVTFCSIGENCLGQGIIDRHRLKSCIGPFTWARSNIDYILRIIDEDFVDFLNPAYLSHRQRYGQQMATNFKYQCKSEKFDKTVANEFEFTHHDVIADAEALDNITRKTNRFRELIISDEPVVFVYHHRINPQSTDSISYAVEKLNVFAEIIQKSRRGQVSILCFTQKIVAAPEDRRVEFSEHNAVRLAVLHTNSVWGGSDPDIFWARNDDDLFTEVLLTFSQVNSIFRR